MDEFEKLLSKQPLREVPPAWRKEILSVLPGPKAVGPRWREWLWPSPVAWAGLACIWVVILMLNVATRPSAMERQLAERSPVPSPDVALALARQRSELAQLLGSTVESPVEPKRRYPPGPQSESRRVSGEA
jgi:hypothetical protein